MDTDTMDREALEPLFEAVVDAFDAALGEIVEQARATSCNLYNNQVMFYAGLSRDDVYAALDMLRENYPAFSFSHGKDPEQMESFTLSVSLD
jgi:hypothetical protein